MSGLHGIMGSVHNSLHRDLADMLGIGTRQLQGILHTAHEQNVSFMQAAQMHGVDFNRIDARNFVDSFRELPQQAQTAIARDAGSLPATLREVVTSAVPPPPSSDSSATATATTTGNTNASSTAGTSSSSSAVNGQMRTDAPAQSIPLDAGIRIVPGPAPQRGEGVDNHSLIQRLFGGEGQQRADGGQNLGALANRALSQGPEAVQNPQSLLQARNDGNQVQAPQQTSVWAREGSPQQQATPQAVSMPARADAAATNASNFVAAPQGTPQTAAYAGQQSANPAQLGDRAVMQSPLPANVRGEGNLMGAARAPDAALPPATLERMQPAQQQLGNQQQATIPNIPGRPELAGGQLAATLAGATVVANPQAHTMAQQAGQNAMPNRVGSDPALAARDALLAPAGHTLTGLLRRDTRNGMQLHRRAADWVAAMLAGRRKQQAESAQPSAVSVQWLFWILTVIAYGAIGTAVVFMLPNGGEAGMGLTTSTGSPSTAGYALLVGAIAATASWIMGRRIARTGDR